MFEQSTVAVYDSLAQAGDAVGLLQREGYPRDQISMVTRSVQNERKLRQVIEHGDRTESGAAAGGILGGLVGALVGASLFLIPGLGPLIILGPLAAAATGSAVGSLIGAISGWGVPADHLGRYEQMLKDGKCLVIAHGDPEEVDRAYALLSGTGAEQLELRAETSEDSPEIDDRPVR